jgi:hypothetical protein
MVAWTIWTHETIRMLPRMLPRHPSWPTPGGATDASWQVFMRRVLGTDAGGELKAGVPAGPSVGTFLGVWRDEDREAVAEQAFHLDWCQ